MAYLGNSQFQGIISGGNIQDGSIESIDLATLTNIDINSGSIDNTIIGAATANVGNFTTLTADSLITGGNIVFNNNTASGIINAAANAGYRPDDAFGNTYMYNYTPGSGWYADYENYYLRTIAGDEILKLTTDALNLKQGSFQVNGTTVIDSNRSLTNIAEYSLPSNGGNNKIVTGTGDGASFTTHNTKIMGWNGLALENATVGGPYASQVTAVYDFRGGQWDTKGGYRVGSTTVIDSSRNILAGTFENGSMWVNDGSANNAYNENIRLFDPTNGVASVIAFGATGPSGMPRNSILSYDREGYGFDFRKGNTRKLSIQDDVLIDNASLNVTSGNISVSGVLSGTETAYGLRLGDFSTANADEWPKVTWLRDVANGWDEGLMKSSTARGVFGREHFGIHFDESRSFAFHSSGWATIAEFRGDGLTYLQGPVGINTSSVASGVSLEVTGDIKTSGTIKVDSEIQFLRGYGEYSNYIRAQNYPSQGYTTSTAKYWIEYGSKGGQHFVLNTDGVPGSPENAYDDFTIWQAEVDGDRLFSVSNVGNTDIFGNLAVSGLSYFSNNLQIGSDTTRKALFIRSESWSETRYWSGGTEYARTGTAAASGSSIYGMTEGDYYVYNAVNGNMNLIVKKSGEVLDQVGRLTSFTTASNYYQVTLGAGSQAEVATGLPGDSIVFASVHLITTDTDYSDHFDVALGEIDNNSTVWSSSPGGYPSVQPGGGITLISHLGDSQGTLQGHYGAWTPAAFRIKSDGGLRVSVMGNNASARVSIKVIGYLVR